MFHQVEGLLTMRPLTSVISKGFVKTFSRRFSSGTICRFAYVYVFSFTEPSAEVDIQCGKCSGEGCRLSNGWIEVLFAWFNPKVLEMSGIDPEGIVACSAWELSALLLHKESAICASILTTTCAF